jgi:circadian clock protein KaiB
VRKPESIKEQSKKWQEALSKAAREKYCLRLYVTGSTPKSIRAITNIKRICEAHLQGRYILEVIDIYQQPVLAKGEQIIAAPTLVKSLPLPLRKFIGDMSDTDRILIGLDLCAVNPVKEAHGKGK